MSTNNTFIGCPYDLESLRSLSDNLNAKVMDQINSTQELVMLNNFAHESNEYLLRKSLEERMSDIASWRWVLLDLSKRLQEAIATLQHEYNALRVVVQRIQREIDEHSQDASKPGALTPFSDSVEDAIIEELNFLCEQKKIFETMIPDLENQIEILKKTSKRIDNDVFNKEKALSIDESCIDIDPNSIRIGANIEKKKRVSPLVRWEKRCEKLKRAGLRALSNAIVIRQQVRGARVHLSIAAQSYAAKVDSVLRRRLHSNKIKLQDLNWQKDEFGYVAAAAPKRGVSLAADALRKKKYFVQAVRDYKALEEELKTTEQNILETMDQERIVEARLADRDFRPTGEHTKDNVDKKLKSELGRLKSFTKHLRNNYKRITTLQYSLNNCLSRVNCCAEDIIQVVGLDEERIRFRLGESPDSATIPVHDFSSRQTESTKSSMVHSDVPLTSIKEEDEDDYPFDD